jgi:hypothetical protein
MGRSKSRDVDRRNLAQMTMSLKDGVCDISFMDTAWDGDTN